MKARAALLSLTLAAATAAQAAPDHRRLCLEIDGPEARAPCDIAYAADPDDLDVAFKLAWTRIGNHEPAEGIDFLREVAAAHPDDWRGHFNLAGALAAVAAYHLAGPPVERALALNDAPFIKHLAAEIYQNNGEPGRAHQMHLALAAAGWRNAMFELAEDYALGRGVAYDQPQARLWYQAAAQAGHVLAMRILAEKLEIGAFGGDPDPEGAAHWRGEAASATKGLPGG
jgi:TPR repeat protein